MLAGRWPWLDNSTRLLLNDYFVPTLLAVILLALWFEGKDGLARYTNQRAVLVAALGAALANLLLKILNLVHFRQRPFDLYEVNLLFYQPTDSSLPSNAAALGFSVAAGVWLHQRRWGMVLIILATSFGLSRIVGGVHFPFDVISGAALGWLAALVIYHQHGLVSWLLNLVIKISAKLGLP